MTPISITQQLRDLATEQASLRPLPDLQALEHRLAVVGAQAQLDTALRGELAVANLNLEQAKAAHARNAAINTELARLTHEQSVQEAEERARLINAATEQVSALRADFAAQAKALCRLYEQMHQLNSRYQQTIPGYRAARLPEFDFPMMTPAGWQGITSEHVRTNALHWLNAEKKEAA
jgi:hypothetical protein